MGTRTSHAPGTFSWVDLQVPDVEAAKSFYGTILGWEFDDMPMDGGGTYSMAKVSGGGDGEHIAAIVGLGSADVPPHFNSYVSVESADAALDAARSAGATVIEEAFDVMTAGRMGLFADPTGGLLCVWEPHDHIGARRVNDVGCLTWNELGTNDPATAAKFYGEVFGWSYDEQDMGGGEMYRTIKLGERMNGGIRKFTEAEAGTPPNWLPYFTVEDADATAATVPESGGRVLAPPVTIPSPNEPRIAVFADPAGAPFAVFAGPTED